MYFYIYSGIKFQKKYVKFKRNKNVAFNFNI